MKGEDSNSPIFVVGAPRSGTSVLTWCLGQHPNILPTEESNWMGDFACAAAVAHANGSSRGDRSQLSACGLSREDFVSAIGTAVNRLLADQREALLANADRAAIEDPALVASGIRLARNPDDPKRRWVDGTPEYSLQISALKALFPAARFVHIVRDVREVVRSLMLFRAGKSGRLVQNEREAIEYWLRCVNACIAAEQAWGSRVVLRVRYSSLVAQPEVEIRRILEFLGEAYSAACVEPLGVRLNSSRVPADFDPAEPDTDPALRAEAERTFAMVENLPGDDLPPDAAKIAEQSRAFAERVDYLRTLDFEYMRAQRINAQVNDELEDRSRWALDLERQVAANLARIVALQEELDERNDWGRNLDREIAVERARIAELSRAIDERTAWALGQDARISEQDARIVHLQQESAERTAWALSQDAEIASCRAMIATLQRQVEDHAEKAAAVERQSSDKDREIIALKGLLEAARTAGSSTPGTVDPRTRTR